MTHTPPPERPPTDTARDLRTWARRLDSAVDELYVQLKRLPHLIDPDAERDDREGGHGTR